MLTRADLRWIDKLFSLYSKLTIIPVKFKPGHLGGHMENESINSPLIGKRVGFKIYQLLASYQASFISFRTLNYVTGTDGELDWDFVPMMISASTVFLSISLIGHFLFDSVRTLNTKVYNENRKLRGKDKRNFYFS